MAIADQLDRLNVLRQNLASALTGKGVTAESTEGFETLVPKVSEIAGTAQVQWYEGTFTTDSDGKATVDCGFCPDVVTLMIGINDLGSEVNASVDFSSKQTTTKSYVAAWTTDNEGVDEFGFAATSTGFTCNAAHYNDNWRWSSRANKTYNYVAIKFTE